MFSFWYWSREGHFKQITIKGWAKALTIRKLFALAYLSFSFLRPKDAKKFPWSLFLSFDSGTETFFIRSAPKLCVFLVLSVFIVPLRKLYILNFHCGSFFLYHRSCKMLFSILTFSLLAHFSTPSPVICENRKPFRVLQKACVVLGATFVADSCPT